MRVLFLHQAFPGPFRRLAVHYGSQSGNRVLFLSERGRRSVPLPGVRHLTAPSPKRGAAPSDVRDELGDGESTEGTTAAATAEQDIAQALRQGAATANALLRLKQEGFQPDIICSGTGGEAFYLRDIFPDAFHVVHADWYHTKGSAYTFFSRGKSRPAADFAPGRVRNLLQHNTLLECHLAITSSKWQKSQFPPCLSTHMHVVPEGVDTSFFTPGENPAASLGTGELITFSARCPGSLHGLSRFYQALALLLPQRPGSRALIVGAKLDDARRAALNAELPVGLAPPDPERVRSVLPSSPEKYLNLLHASSVHVYLTAPSTLSSGLFEAMSCGCLVIGSDTEPVREVIEHGTNGFLCDFWDAANLATSLGGLLDRAMRMQSVRDAARDTITRKYEAGLLTQRHVELVESGYQAWRAGKTVSSR